MLWIIYGPDPCSATSQTWSKLTHSERRRVNSKYWNSTQISFLCWLGQFRPSLWLCLEISLSSLGRWELIANKTSFSFGWIKATRKADRTLEVRSQRAIYRFILTNGALSMVPLTLSFLTGRAWARRISVKEHWSSWTYNFVGLLNPLRMFSVNAPFFCSNLSWNIVGVTTDDGSHIQCKRIPDFISFR